MYGYGFGAGCQVVPQILHKLKLLRGAEIENRWRGWIHPDPRIFSVSKSAGHTEPEFLVPGHSLTFRSRRALPITDTELNVIAAAAIMGLSSNPNTGYSAPPAIGIPMAL